MRALFLIVFAALPVVADEPPPPFEPQEPVSVALLAADAGVRPGATLLAGIRFTMRPGWHVYWKNPGDSGLAPLVEWRDLPAGVTVTALPWPAPRRIPAGPYMTFGYEGAMTLLYEVRVRKTFAAERLVLAADVSWLVCKEVCLDGARRVSRALPVVAEAPRAAAGRAALERARRALPRPGKFAVRATDAGYEILSDTLGAGAVFYPAEAGVVHHAGAQTAGAGRLAVPKDPDGEPATRLRGVVVAGERAFLVDAPIEHTENRNPEKETR